MKRNAVYGVGQGLNGREAAMQAAQQALDALGAARPALALLFAAQEFAPADALAGLGSLLGDVPVWGFNTPRPMAGAGEHARSVVVALLAGPELKAQAAWLPGYSQDAQSAASQFAAALGQGSFLPRDVLFAVDGTSAGPGPLCDALAGLPYGVCGCAAAGEGAFGKTHLFGGHHSGPGALSALALGGRLRLGVGMAHGWRSVGPFFHVTRARDVWLQSLDGQPAALTYAHYFGYSPREWASAPLSEMARLYPLGVETGPAGGASGGLVLRAPLRVEGDGSLRMSTPVPQDAVVHLMAGDPQACLQAARAAAEQALRALDAGRVRARPLLALALVDSAWQMLYETRPNQVASMLQSALGEVPLVGAYTFAQAARPQPDAAPQVHNQNLLVVVFGEAVDG